MLDKILEKVGKPFQKGEILEPLFPVFESADTFLMTPARVTGSGPHVRDALDLKRMMITVVLALLPCTLYGIYNTGFQTLSAAGMDSSPAACVLQGLLYFVPLYAVTLLVGGHIELIFSIVRRHEINEGFLVTSALFPLVLPPTLPWWIAAVGIAFGVTIGKEVFGGTGMNIFNPALVARSFLFFAYPAQMSGDVWVGQPIQNFHEFIFGFPDANGKFVDGFSGATPLSVAAAGEDMKAAGYDFMSMFLGTIPGSIGETSALCVLIGAIILIATGIGSYKTMLGCVIGCLGTATLFWWGTSGSGAPALLQLPPYYHLVMGGFAFGTVYMATDPVSSPATGTGKWIYGILIGTLCVLIRNINPAFPEGMMLAILFMNLFAPLIDHYVIESRIRRRAANV